MTLGAGSAAPNTSGEASDGEKSDGEAGDALPSSATDVGVISRASACESRTHCSAQVFARCEWAQ